MPFIQISQIILRAGPSDDLPGAPTSFNPLTFPEGLAKGEMAFADDTGRIFIGHDPSQGQPQFNRATFPYQNIEVLTENSTDTLSAMIGSTVKEAGNESFYEAALPTQTTDWSGVVVPRVGDSNYVYRLPYSDSVAAQIDYTVFDADLKPIKVGTLSVTYFVGEAEPQVIDDAMINRRDDLLDPEVYQAGSVYSFVDFKFIVDGPTGARFLSFQYKNHTTDVLSLRFKTTRPRA